MSRKLIATVLLATSTGIGCTAALQPPPIKTSAALGSVVVYRNGVAYFERRALVQGDRFELDVPTERLDDFLKSLTIVDAKTGESLPVSFPTVEEGGEEATLLIRLPHKGKHDLKISYVTESPAWKPSYRLVLGENGQAKLEAWAVVDNVSGEDWDRVKVGVGSTSALSFRYDLKSVRVVERQTLSSGTQVAGAPPDGGSPYQVASSELQVLGGFDDEELALAFGDGSNKGGTHSAYGGLAAPSSSLREELEDRAASKRRPVTKESKPLRSARSRIRTLANRLKDSNEKVRIEGYANAGDQDQRRASLERANTMRRNLIAEGVPADQIEAVGTGRISSTQGVRVLTDNNQQAGPVQAKQAQDLGAPTGPSGSAYFVAAAPMSIANKHSAMVSMLNQAAEAKQVYYYDPISSRGSKRFAFKSVLLKNPSKYTLDRGPFTVYQDGQFLGEGLSEPIAAFSQAFIPFALDRQLVVEPEVGEREEIHRLQTIDRGVINTETRRIRRTLLTLANRGGKPATVYVRHTVPSGWELKDPPKDLMKLGGAYMFKVNVPAGSSGKFAIEEVTPVAKSFDIRTNAGLKAVSGFLAQGDSVAPELRAKLSEVITLTRAMANFGQQIDTANQQMRAYRARVNEINLQLVTLRKVTHANKLKTHLAKKMQEISERLQTRTIELANLEGQLLTARISLQDKLAELTLSSDKPSERVASSASRL